MRTRNNKRAKLSPNDTLDALDNDLLVQCASYLDADGLAWLGRTSARFGTPQAGRERSLVNETAHRRFQQGATDEERGCLPKYGDESDIGLCRALEQLRKPLCFDELVGGGFGHQECAAIVTHARRGCWSTAVSAHVMRGGRHFVEFAISDVERGQTEVHFGVIRPVSLTDGIDLEDDWEGSVDPMYVWSSYKHTVAEILRSRRSVKWGDSIVHCCTYYCEDGRCSQTDWSNSRKESNWQGHESLRESGTIGLLLNLDEGTLSVYKNGRRLGVMKDGLEGQYCWFVSSWCACTIRMSKGG